MNESVKISLVKGLEYLTKEGKLFSIEGKYFIEKNLHKFQEETGNPL